MPPVQGEDKALRRAPSWRKRFRPRDPHGRASLSTAADTLPATFRASTVGPVPPPPSPRKKITPEGERQARRDETRRGGAGRGGAGSANAAAGGRAPPASFTLTNPLLCVPRRLSTPSPDGRGAETGDPSSADLLLLSPPPTPGPSRLCPRLGVRGPGPGHRRSAPAVRRLKASPRPWLAGRPCCSSADRTPCSACPYCFLRLWALRAYRHAADTLQPVSRGVAPNSLRKCLSLSLSQLAPTISMDTCSPPSGTSHSPARPASSCLVSQARIALTVLLVPLTPRAPSLLSQNILVYPSGSRYPKSTVCPL